MKKVIAAVLCSFLLSAAAAEGAGDAITFSGSILSEKPQVQSTQTKIPVAFVKDYKLTLNADAGICELTTDELYARRTTNTAGKWICLLEWDAELRGLSKSSLNLSGVLNASGNVKLGYKLAVYSAGQKHELSADFIQASVLQPAAPLIKDYSVRWSKKTERTTGPEHWVFDKSDKVAEVTVIVEPRPFEQVVQIDGKTCNVTEDSDRCSVGITKSFLEETEKQGSLVYAGKATDAKDYFSTAASSNVSVNWDFREPHVTQIALNTEAGAGPLPVAFNGGSIALENNQAAVIVASPHVGRNDEWWIPKDLALNLNMANGKKHSPVEEIVGTTVRFNVPNVAYASDFSLKPIAAPEFIGGHLVYKYELNKVPDGLYNVAATAADSFGNSGSMTLNESLIDRFGPDIQVLNKAKLLGGTKAELYFPQDLTIAASGGWDDGTVIKSARWNGTDSVLVGDSPRIKSMEYQEFELDSDLTLEVVAEDGAGNQTTKTFAFRYMPVEFSMVGVPESMFQTVESVRMRLGQTKGARCKVSSSTELAQLQSKGLYKGCTVEWSDLPAGLEEVTDPNAFTLVGGIDEVGAVEWGYKVYFHSADGHKALAKEGTAIINVMPAEAPEFSLSNINKLAEGVYGIAHNSTQITRYELLTVPADNMLHIKAENGEMDSEILIKQRLTKAKYSVRNSLKRPNLADRRAWDKTTYTVEAYHKRKPESRASQTFELITFPDGSVRPKLTLGLNETTNANTIEAHVAVGRQRGSAFEYDIAKMGKWTAHLSIRENGVHVPVTEKLLLSEAGNATFTLDAGEVFRRADRVYAVVESVTEYESYKRTLVSNSARLAVLQADAVEGELTARTTQGRVPFTASMRFEFSDKDDKAASVPVAWEASVDQDSWTDLGVRSGLRMHSVRITGVGVTYYRVKMQNRLTAEVSYTLPLRVIGYETPEIWIEGPEAVYEGTQATLTVFSDETEEVTTDGFTEWSVDNGATWTTGDTMKSFDVVSEMKVLARYRLNTTDGDIGDDGYRTASHRIAILPVKPVVLKASGPKHAEIGVPIVLEGSARHYNRSAVGKIISYWQSPSGKRVDGDRVEYVVTPGDVQDGELGRFQYIAYVEGLENETKGSKDVPISLWSYSMPEVKLVLLSRIQIAPATIAARIDTPYFYAPGVELTYEWLLPESVKVDRTTSSLTYLVAETPGVHKLGIRVVDNRGNSKEIYEFIDIVQADPLVMGVELRPSNIFERAPVSYSARTNAKPGHPNDSIASYVWLLDGTVLEGQTKPYTSVDIAEPGAYQLTVKFTTEYGQEGELNELLTVAPNKPPVCEPFISETSSSITVNANCKDEDGKIVSLKYAWREDGYESSGGTRLRFTKSLHQSLDVKLRATDDSGAETVTQVKWSNPSIVGQ